MVATVYGPPNGKFEPILPFSLAPWAPPHPMRLTLSNIAYDSARVQAVVTPLPDCAVPDGVVPVEFNLPLNSTRIIEAPPGMDVCWRRAMQPQTEQVLPGMPRLAGTGWTPWSREFLSSGRSIDARI